MNIFFLEKSIKNCAISHNDKHVVKMRLEIAQMCCTAHWLKGSQAPYKPTHKNHPSTVWVRTCIENYRYAVDLGLALCDELLHRFGTPEQKCKQVLLWLKENEPELPENGSKTVPPLAMSDEYKLGDSNFDQVIQSYQNYYRQGKTHLLKYTKRQTPIWV